MPRPLRSAARSVTRASLVQALGLALVTGWGAPGCGGRALPADWDFDDGGAPDAEPGGGVQALAKFCAGPPRVEVNGVVAAADVEGHAQWPSYQNEGADLAFTSTVTNPARWVLAWHAPGSAAPVAPATLALDAIPTGWTVAVYAGCSPGEGGCAAPAAVVPGGFSGTLAIGGEQLDYTLTLCLEYQEPHTAPGATVHSLRLWAGGVPAPYDWP